MSTCPDCNHPVGWDQMAGQCPRNMQNYQSDECRARQVAWLKSKLSTAEAKLVETERENKAWRALAGVRALQHRGDDGYWFEAFGKPATIESHPTQQAAAIASATKLGLLDKEGG